MLTFLFWVPKRPKNLDYLIVCFPVSSLKKVTRINSTGTSIAGLGAQKCNFRRQENSTRKVQHVQCRVPGATVRRLTELCSPSLLVFGTVIELCWDCAGTVWDSVGVLGPHYLTITSQSLTGERRQSISQQRILEGAASPSFPVTTK